MVILAPSCNLDVYINYCYNQLTHTHYWKCVCACVCVLFIFLCVFLPFLSHPLHVSLCCLSLSLPLFCVCVRWEQFSTGCICVCVCAHVHAHMHMRVCSHMEPILRPDDHFATTRPLHATRASYTHTRTHTEMHWVPHSGSTCVIRKLIG